MPVDVNDPPHQYTGGQKDARDEAKETGDTDSTIDYRAEQPGYQSTAQRPRRSRSPWFWVILVAMVMAILSFTPLETASASSGK